MQVLAINCGSSSVKFELFEMPAEQVLARGSVERVGEEQGRMRWTRGSDRGELERPFPDHEAALRAIVEALGDVHIGAVGHRVVHAGEAFSGTVLIDDDVIAALEEHTPLAPLHNPANLLGIAVARRVFADVPQVAVFDTAFHQTMPPRAYLYAVPWELYAEHRVRRYGFHGTSHRFVSERAAQLLGREPGDCNLITAHLGNGASITAIEGGRSIDTSMGLTPLEGLVMGTRSGDVDPSLAAFLGRQTGRSVQEVDRLLNKASGLLGLSGLSNDLRTVEQAAAEGHERAELALDVYAYRVRKYIGAYTAALGRVDALVFTGGVGENGAAMRARITERLAPLGYALDPARNAALSGEGDIATESSGARILVVPTHEELVIARDAWTAAC